MITIINILLYLSAFSFFISLWYKGKYKNPNSTNEEIFFKTFRRFLGIDSFLLIKNGNNKFSQKSNFYLKLCYGLFLTVIIAYLILFFLSRVQK
jgi:hypothetical protein